MNEPISSHGTHEPSEPSAAEAPPRVSVFSTKNAVQIGLFALSVGILVSLLYQVGWDVIGSAVARIGYGGAVALVAFGMAESMFDGLSLALIVKEPGSARIPFINAAGAVVNQVLPLDVGELLKVALIRRFLDARRAIAGVMIWNVMFKITRPVVLVVASAVGIGLGTVVPRAFRDAILIGTAVSFVPYLIVHVVVRLGIASGVARLLKLLHLIRGDAEAFIASARDVDERLANFRADRSRDYAIAFGLQMLGRVSGWVALVAAIRWVGLELTFADGALMYASINLVEYVASALPTKFGVTEGAAFAIFEVCGLPAEMGVVVYAVLRLRSIVANGVLAPFAYVTWGGNDSPRTTAP